LVGFQIDSFDRAKVRNPMVTQFNAGIGMDAHVERSVIER
jgi:hypothetical protein